MFVENSCEDRLYVQHAELQCISSVWYVSWTIMFTFQSSMAAYHFSL
jgi:hypothetical protein